MRIGIDLGGTKIEGVALGDDGAQLARRRVATPRHDYDGDAGVDGRPRPRSRGGDGLPWQRRASGMPGALSPATGLVKNANSTWLIGQPLDRDLSGLLGRQVRFANDANCFALSEAVDGAAAGARVVFGVIVGTGTGGGVVVDRKVLTGAERDRRRVGAQPAAVAPRRRVARARLLLRQDRLHRDVPVRAGPGSRLPAGDRARPSAHRRSWRRAQRGDAAAAAALRRYEERLARALAVVLNILDPDVVVLGGGMSQIARLYESVPRLWQEWAFSDRVDTELRPPVHGDSSGVRGAAWLWGPGEA